MFDTITPDPVALQARLRPDALAAADLQGGRRWTYTQLHQDIDRASAVLAALGIVPGARVAALARNCVHLIVLQHALMRMGAIFVPLNWRLTDTELVRLLADCEPALLLAEGDAPALPGPGRVMALAELIVLIDAADPAEPAAAHKGEDVCVILYTSGTSGTPKGAMLTAGNLLATGINSTVLVEVDNRSVFLCDSPMFHVIGLVTQIWAPLIRGGTVLISAGFDPLATNDRLADAGLGVTHYFCVPQMADALRHAANFQPRNWTRLTALFTGGAPNPAANIRWWLDHGVTMVDGYGMTEAGTLLGMPTDMAVVRDKAGAVGLPGPLTSIRLVDEDGADVAEGSAGEIIVYGPNVTPGYWNRPEERANSFTEDGWLRTGDVGRRDADGYISIVDRRKDMFISGGENVYPVEVEAALREHAAVRDAAVIGIADARWGEVGRAYVILVPGGSADLEALIAHCQGLIARYKVPKEFRFVTELPRTGSGKVMKHILRSHG